MNPDEKGNKTMTNTQGKKQKKKLGTLDIVYVGVFAALIAICAQIAIPLTISFTLQTFAICLTAGLLGAKRGTLAVVTYICIGMIGLPVFTGFKSGVAAIAGPTGGYIVGFVFTAIIIGFLVEKFGNKLYQLMLFMTIGLALCYSFGTVWFVFVYHVSFMSAITTCVLPFLLPEAVKITLAAILTKRLRKHIKQL